MIAVMELQLIFFLLSFLHGIYGQVTVPPSTAVGRGEDVSLVCTSTEDNPTFTWTDITNGQALYIGTTRGTTLPRYNNIVLQEGVTDVQMSILDISDIQLEDDGVYLCGTTTTAGTSNTVVTVEVGSVGTMELIITRNDSNSPFMYQATCNAIGSKPEETITWILDGDTQTDDIVETDPHNSTDPLLFDKRSVFTFPSNIKNYDVQLVCDISGHQVARFNRQETEQVDIHKPPQSESGVIMIDITLNGTELTISCDDTDSTAVPAMSTFNISSGEELINKPESDKAVTITEPEGPTEFKCVGSNYLGTTTTTKTYGSTTAPPTTAQEKTTPVVKDTTSGGPDPLPIGLIIGCVVAVIVIIGIIIVVIVVGKKKRWFKSSGPKSSGSSKPAGSAVGSSNGSEREKTKPEAAPRGHGSIQHTNDNPNQDMYAMVDKKPSGGRGGDAPDRGSGPGQNEPQGMLYADLDLSHKAGHTDKHVPKNENDVVVYSSILV